MVRVRLRRWLRYAQVWVLLAWCDLLFWCIVRLTPLAWLEARAVDPYRYRVGFWRALRAMVAVRLVAWSEPPRRRLNAWAEEWLR